MRAGEGEELHDGHLGGGIAEGAGGLALVVRLCARSRAVPGACGAATSGAASSAKLAPAEIARGADGDDTSGEVIVSIGVILACQPLYLVSYCLCRRAVEDLAAGQHRAAQRRQRRAQFAFRQASDCRLGLRQVASDRAGGVAAARAASTSIVCTKRRPLTTWLPRWVLIRAISSPPRYCSSIAIGPAQAIVSVPDDQPARRGHGGDRRADDGGPVGEHLRGRRRAAAERRTRQARHQRAERAGAVDVARVCGHTAVCVLRRHRTCLSAPGVVRPPSSIAALARLTRRSRRIPTGSGSARSCCSRPL